MYSCPTCGARSISFKRKWLSWSASPARCTACGATCAIAIVDASGIMVGATVLVTASGFIAAAVNAVYPLLLGVVVAVAFYFWRQHQAPLLVITQEETKVAKRSATLGLFALLFPGFFS